MDFCTDGGVDPYRDLTLRELALQFGFGNVAGILDYSCGYDWERWLHSPPA